MLHDEEEQYFDEVLDKADSLKLILADRQGNANRLTPYFFS